MRLVKKMYEHKLTLRTQQFAARVDLYLVDENGKRGKWIGALLRVKGGEFVEHGLVPPDLRRNFEEMLRSK